MYSLVTITTLLDAAFGALLQERACNSDNCLRALQAKGTLASADCSAQLPSYYRTVVSPTTTYTYTADAFTTTVTSSTAIPTTVFSIVGSGVVKPTSTTPSYAGACSSAARYSSACSCIGATASTYTADAVFTTITPPGAPTSTVTLDSVSYTATITVGVCDPAQNYGLNYSAGYVTHHASPLGSQYGDPNDPQYRTFIDYAPGTTLQQCCQHCFQSLECYSYSYQRYAGNPNDLRCSNEFHGSGRTLEKNSYCPRFGNQYFEFGTFVDTRRGNIVGIGPCADPLFCGSGECGVY